MYKIKTIELEITTICNAYCPVCIRYKPTDDGLFVNPLADINKQIDVDIVEHVFQSDRIDNNINVDLIGTAGEPLAHPKILDIVKIILTHKPRASINIHTNGGIRTEKFFAELASILTDRCKVGFSIDGMRDTNGIYRIGVDWDKAIANMKSFIGEGGIATWQFVIFDWNKHQLEECKQLAINIGCVLFETRTNVTPEMSGALEAAAKQVSMKPLDHVEPSNQIEELEYDYIDDICVQDQKLFIDPNGLIYPCCMFYASRTGPKQFSADKSMYEKYGSGWNDLTLHTLDDVLDHVWWNELHHDLKHNPSDACIDQCGACDDERSHSNIEETTYRL